jgi:hypothetical protein
VAHGLVGTGQREVACRLVEPVARAEMAGDLRDPNAARMRAGQRPAAELAVDRHRLLVEGLDRRLDLRAAHAGLPITGPVRPPQERIGSRRHQP